MNDDDIDLLRVVFVEELVEIVVNVDVLWDKLEVSVIGNVDTSSMKICVKNEVELKLSVKEDLDDEEFDFDVFSDGVNDIIGLGEDDFVEFIIKMFKYELLFSDGKRVASIANA